jgi:heme-degrading monooxygenase HmoA
VVSLWDSRDQFETFLKDRLHLTMADTGDQQPTLTFWDIEKVHHFD